MVVLEEFIRKESSGGMVLIGATLLALLLSNTAAAPLYTSLLHLPVGIMVGNFHLNQSLYHWVNDGLMAIFFLLIGLEVKRELLEGHLSSVRQMALPGIAAIGGMVVPAAIYLLFNYDHPVAQAGWAIPTATDIAFALGVLSLLGSRVPVSLKLFLMALAIIDDLGAIVIIALFYTAKLSTVSVAVAMVALTVLMAMNLFGVTRKGAYYLVGLLLWVSVLNSGVHATLAGVALAFTIPLRALECSPLEEMEHQLQNWVAFLILPLFAFVNAGVNVTAISLAQMAGSVPLGILCGLVIGKPLGVFGCSWLAIKYRLASLPEGSNWRQFAGISVLTGIGFTMSLFIVSLAFEDDTLFHYTDKLAILIASLLSGVVGSLLLGIKANRREQVK